MISMSNIKLITSVLIFTLLSGCSLLNPYSDITKANVRLRGTDYLNPDLRGRPSPVVVRIYELKNGVNFINADFFSLYDNAKNVLGNDLVAMEEIELRPGQKLHLRYRVATDSQYVGVIAAYRDISTANWRQLAKLEPKEKTYVNLVLTSDGIYLSTDPRANRGNELLPIENR